MPNPDKRPREKYELKIKIDGLPPTINAIGRKHWAVINKDRKRWHEAVAVAIADNKPISPLSTASIVITRHSTTPPDYDGLVSSSKALIDGLVLSGVLKDDGWENIGAPEFKWKKAKRGKGFVEVEIREI